MVACFANLTPCVVGLEACCGTHYWSHVISRFGHTVRLIAPQFVKPSRRPAGSGPMGERHAPQVPLTWLAGDSSGLSVGLPSVP